jgi:hypothetical protein
MSLLKYKLYQIKKGNKKNQLKFFEDFLFENIIYQ